MKIFMPFEIVSKKVFYTIVVVEVVLALLLWSKFATAIIPSPMEVAKQLDILVQDGDFYTQVVTSLILATKGIIFSLCIALVVGYLYFIPVIKPITTFIIKTRFLPPAGLFFLFNLLTHSSGNLKISLLLFGIVPFFVSTLVSILSSISIQEYDLCKTLRMSRWKMLWEIVIIGRLDQIVETVRQNFAIAWLTITMVEGVSMSGGGIGVLIINANKFMSLSKVFALLVVIFILGVALDIFFGTLRLVIFPYVKFQVVNFGLENVLASYVEKILYFLDWCIEKIKTLLFYKKEVKA